MAGVAGMEENKYPVMVPYRAESNLLTEISQLYAQNTATHS
jgi:hypothetical protein